MIKTMKKIFTLTVFIILLACNNKKNTEKVYLNYFDNDTLTFQTFKVDTGWGYKIYKNKKLFIYQNLIPAVNGHFLFKSQKDAEKTALLVIKKMTKEAGLPALTISELDSIGVLDSFILNYQKIDFSTKNPETLKLINKHK